MRRECCDRKERDSAFSQVEEKDNRVCRTVWIQWIQWPGTSDPQEVTNIRILVDTSIQCTLKPSRYVRDMKYTESMCI